MASDRANIQGDELPPGSILCGGQYTIDQYLSAGGFGVTYLARDSLGRRVVIKECFPSALCFRTNRTVCVRSQGNNVEFGAILELFEKEARALASLQHPYIVGVHQYFRDNETAYMAMDFVEGRTLLDILENDPARLTPEVVKTLLMQILQAVSFIHRNDILHRDISPDNILIDRDNLPVLIDFGAAREDATRVSRVLSKVLTVKDGYSPQEFYLAGSDQVYASDLYALAATFHHVVTGKAPASSHSRMAAAVRNAPDPLKLLGRMEGYDIAFLEAINTCLSLFPKDRLQTSDAWQEAINAEMRQKKLMRLAEQDRNLDHKVATLVKDFFKDFQPIKSGIDKAVDSSASRDRLQRTTHKIYNGPLGLEDTATDAQPDSETTELTGEEIIDPSEKILASDPREAGQTGPALLPIERIRLKYSKPPDPEPEPAPASLPSTLSGWLARIGLPSRTGNKSGDGDEKSEELA